MAPQKRRRGVRNDQLYKRNAIRNARVKGSEYKSYNNKTIPAITQNLGINLCR